MPTAIYPGTFDPVHNGHIDIATRAAKLFDHLTLAIYARPLKNLLFTTEERKAMLESSLAQVPNVSVATYNQLTVDYAKEIGELPDDICIVDGRPVVYDVSTESEGSFVLIYLRNNGDVVAKACMPNPILGAGLHEKGEFYWTGGHCPN